MTEVAQLPGLLIRTSTAAATATLGFVALFFFMRARGRRDLLFYALLAVGMAVYQGLTLASGTGAGSTGGTLPRLRTILSFLLPAAGYLFLLDFIELSVTGLRRVLLALSGLGLIGTAFFFAVTRPFLPSLAGLVLLMLGLELLVALWRKARGRRRDAPVLFLATAILVLAALLEGALDRRIVLLPLEGHSLLGPAFLVFSALVLVSVANEHEELLLRATTDPLTGLHNRATFLERLRREVERSERTGEPLAVVMIDIDHFKGVNDRFGHPAGDRVLAAISQAIGTAIRGIDVAGRYGGEEFALLLIDVEEEAALAAVERTRGAIASLASPRVPVSVTASAGIAVHHGRFARERPEELIGRADRALYRSKQGGRDRSTIDEVTPTGARSPADVRYR